MSDERAAVRTIFRGQEFVDASDYDALRAENEKLNSAWNAQREVAEFLLRDSDTLRAKVSELTRLLGEAEEAILDMHRRYPKAALRNGLWSRTVRRALKGASR